MTCVLSWVEIAPYVYIYYLLETKHYFPVQVYNNFLFYRKFQKTTELLSLDYVVWFNVEQCHVVFIESIFN